MFSMEFSVKTVTEVVHHFYLMTITDVSFATGESEPTSKQVGHTKRLPTLRLSWQGVEVCCGKRDETKELTQYQNGGNLLSFFF